MKYNKEVGGVSCGSFSNFQTREGERGTYCVFANFFARRAFAPMPGAWLYWPFVAFPSGAWGTTTCAAWEGLCSGWMGVPMGESVGVEVADMLAAV